MAGFIFAGRSSLESSRKGFSLHFVRVRAHGILDSNRVSVASSARNAIHPVFVISFFPGVRGRSA